MNFKWIVWCGWWLGIAGGLMAEEVAPDPRVILEGARMSATLTRLDEGLTGYLKKGSEKVPVTLFLKGKDIQFQYAEDRKNWRIFHMRMGDEKFELFEIVDGKTRAFGSEKLVSPIAGSDLTYEDLAMRFFYWPNPQYEAVEKVGGELCYRLRVDKPADVAGRYEKVYIWVHQKYGAFMKIRGVDAKGAMLKEFQVEDVMQVEQNLWTLRKMQVASYDAASGRRVSITDLVFESPKKRKPTGLR